MSSNSALRYYLPKTVLDVAAQVRYVVVVDSAGGHLEPRVDVRLTSRVVPDRTARCTTTLDSGILESGSLGVELTPEGLVDAVGSHVQAIRPAFTGVPATRSSLGPARSGESAQPPADLGIRAGWTRAGALRVAFDRSHPRTAALISDLSARAEQFLAGMRMGDGPAEVETFGSALAVVERELAAADRLRREWIAAQGFDVRAGHWQVDLADAVPLAEPLPDRLPADTAPAAGAAALARDYGVLLAVADPERDIPDGAAAGPEGYHRVDELLIRQVRPVVVAVYRRAPAGIEGEPETSGEWVLDPVLTSHVEAVDGHSRLDVVAPQGHFGADRALHVSFYPSGSVRTFGVSSAPVLPATAGMAVEEAAGRETTGLPTRADVAAAALEAARLQLALLQSSDEFTRLAATHAHGGELATLEQDARFAALRSRRG
ncbi:MAG TPA: hypothetical protein VFP72_17465 [Kineosporiaceae bacterium]|nr:hypothetical protein [Kineosporiaceae bacterium]